MSDTLHLLAEPLPVQPPVTMLTAPNPGPKTLSGTHTYLVGGETAYVIDPGPDLPDYQRALACYLETRARVAGILLTHGHPDHAPGAPLLSKLVDAPVWASPAMPQEERERFSVDSTFEQEQRFPAGDDALLVVDTPGHRSDHVAFWLERARVLFSGDTVLGQGTSVIAPGEGDMALYLQSLDRLRQLDPLIIAPGHGPLISDPRAKIDEYIAHRREREEQIRRALAAGPATLDELTVRVYTDIDNRLLSLARASLEAQVIKLEREGHVRHAGKRYRLT